ncbi:MAG TPA: TerC family protein [Polyangiaceae bacterium]|nr:TerC family protein [Polyangiaceae bacterium]
MPFETIGSPILWLGFIAFVLAMLAIDLGVFHRKAHEVSLKEAGVWSAVWVALAVVFNAAVYLWFGPERALEFTTGYLIEKALAVDNIFVFVVIFTTFAVPAIYQHRVLFWGVLGALVMRAAFILAGGAFLQRFHWAMYVFGALLAITGVKLLVQRNQELRPEQNPIVRWFQKLFPMTPEFHGDKFLVVKHGRRYATPLLLALVAVEVTDLIFAVDSIPAIFAVTSDPFIVFTSNIFAILGLRSLYFLLAGIITKFAYLKVGLSFVLIFVGAKMLLVDLYKVPIALSLGVIASILGLSIVASLIKLPKAGTTAMAEDAGP